MIVGKETPEKPRKFYKNKNKLIEKEVALFEPVYLNVIPALCSERSTNWNWKWLEIFREPVPS